MPKVLGIMLIGLLLGREFSRRKLLGDRILLWRTLIGGLALGIPFSLAYALIPDLGQDSLPSILGTAPLGLAYGAAFLLAWPRAKRVLRMLAAPGRIALTNYLSHSLLGIILFYGIGFGLNGTLQPWQFYLVALAIFFRANCCITVLSCPPRAGADEGTVAALDLRATSFLTNRYRSR